MQLPTIVKRIGKIEGENRIYIEDYAYAYLKELNGEKGFFPRRVALYGYTYRKENRNFYFIYGAASVIEELECCRTQEQIKKEYFEDYELIGFVNLYGKSENLPGKKDGYYVFYEANESMQKYLLTFYEVNCQEKIERDTKEKEQQKLNDLEMNLWQIFGIISKKEKKGKRI